MIKDTNSLLEFYYSVGGLLNLKVTPSNTLSAPCFYFYSFQHCYWLCEFYLVAYKVVLIFAGTRPQCCFV